MKKFSRLINEPLLDTIKVQFPSLIDTTEYPFSLNIIKNLQDIHFLTKVTFFVGENGAGKSTLLEAIAHNAGFGAEGGSKNISFKTSKDSVYSGAQKLADHMTLSWRQKPKVLTHEVFLKYYRVLDTIFYLKKMGRLPKLTPQRFTKNNL